MQILRIRCSVEVDVLVPDGCDSEVAAEVQDALYAETEAFGRSFYDRGLGDMRKIDVTVPVLDMHKTKEFEELL